MKGDPDPRDQQLGRVAGYALVLICVIIAIALSYATATGVVSPPWLIGAGVILSPLYYMFLHNRRPPGAQQYNPDSGQPNGNLLVARILDVIPPDDEAETVEELDRGAGDEAPEGDAA